MNIFEWFNKYVLGEDEIAVDSLWIKVSDLHENPFYQKEKIDVYVVSEIKNGNGTGKKDLFVKYNVIGQDDKQLSSWEYTFRHSYIPYTEELKKTWNL